MRQLTKKQKKILDNYINIYRLEDLPEGVFEQLEKINDTEILWSETNRYLSDNYYKNLYNNKGVN
jgi:predicted AlkP superfamily phosphohydrolase/phosphomutase